MLALSDMIRLDIQKNSDIEGNICGTLQRDSLRGYFHYTAVTFLRHHIRKQSVDLAGFRRCVDHRLLRASIIGADCSDHSHPVTGFPQNASHQKSCCRLSIGSCDADHLHFFCRIIKKSGGERGKRFSCIPYRHHADVSLMDQFRHIHFHMFGQNHRT